MSRGAEFGPRTSEVVRFLDQLSRLDMETMRALRAAWLAADPIARSEAWGRLRAAAAHGGRSDAVGRVQDLVRGWATQWQGFAWGPYGLDGVPQGRFFGSEYPQAAPAVVDAGAAFVARDLLDPADFERLAGPWEGVVGG